MATFKSVDVNIPEAAIVEDLRGVAWDLELAHDWAAELLPHRVALTSPNPSPLPYALDVKLFEPITVAIAVMYSRPFTKGVRRCLDESDLAVFTDAQRSAHDYLRAYRNKYVAHSDNEFEHNQVVANYYEELVETEGIISVGCTSSRGPGFGVGNMRDVIELTEIMLTHVYVRIKHEEARLLDLLRAMPIEKVLAEGRRGFSPIRANVARRRKKQGKDNHET